MVLFSVNGYFRLHVFEFSAFLLKEKQSNYLQSQTKSIGPFTSSMNQQGRSQRIFA